MAKKTKKAKGKKSKGVTIGALKDVQANRTIKSGMYTAKVVEVEPGEGDAGDYLAWTFQITKGKEKGKSPKKYYTTLAEGKLWNIKKVLSAIGHDSAESDDEFTLDPTECIDMECTISVDQELYEGRRQSIIVDFGDEDDSEDDDDEEEAEDEEEADEDEDEDEAEVSEESIMAMSEEELEEYVTESELEVDLDDFRVISKKRKAVVKAAKKAKLI